MSMNQSMRESQHSRQNTHARNQTEDLHSYQMSENHYSNNSGINRNQYKNSNPKGKSLGIFTNETKTTTPYFQKLSKESNIKYKSKSKEKFNKLKEEVQKNFQKEHTFQPKINYAFSKTVASREYGNNEELISRLAQPKVLQTNERLKAKEEQERNRLQSECTFHPSISNTSRNIVNKKLEENIRSQVYNTHLLADESNYHSSKNLKYPSGTANERLYKLSEQLKEKRERIRREHEENSEKQFNFTPSIQEQSKILMRKYNQPPIHERYNEVINTKREYLNQMRINKENTEKQRYNNFKPKISGKSKEIANRRLDVSADNINVNCNDRLYQDAYRRRVNQEMKIEKQREQEDYAFKPDLYYSTLNPNTGNIDDFLKRQEIYEELKRDKLERKLNKSAYAGRREFHPQINTTSDILMRADHERANETKQDKIDRLYRKNFEKIRQHKENLQEYYNSQYTFKPKINEVSKYVGRDMKMEDMAYKKESEKVKKLKEAETKENFNECTFKPKLNTSKPEYKNVTSNYKLDENTYYRIDEEMKAKQIKIEEMKKNLEIDEFEYKPKINQKAPIFESNEPIMMKGFSRYLEQMEKARKAKRDQEEREKKVFISGKNWNKNNLVTIPQPFKLSYVRFIVIYRCKWI